MVVRFRMEVLLDHQEGCGSQQRRDDLERGCTFKRAEPLADNGSGRDAAPNSAAEESERLPAVFNSRNLHDPCGGAGVETRFAKTLQDASQISARYSQRKQVSSAGKRATN